jgi:multiple sugar transport system substrate-binding protein
MKRRDVLALGAGVGLLPSIALAQGKPAKMTIMSHAVHRNVATGAKAGDSTAAWRQRHGIELEWITFSVEGVHERVYKEASLSEGAADMVFLLERYGGPHIAALFEDLGEWQKRDPIEDLEEIGAGMRAAHTYRGKIVGIPYRHATHGLFYNQAFLEEVGLKGAPTTLEDVVAYRRRCPAADPARPRRRAGCSCWMPATRSPRSQTGRRRRPRKARSRA